MHIPLRHAVKYTPRIHVVTLTFLILSLSFSPLAGAQDVETPTVPTETVVTEAQVAPEPAVTEPVSVVEPAPATEAPPTSVPEVTIVPVTVPETGDGGDDAIFPPVDPLVPTVPQETVTPEEEDNSAGTEEIPVETSGNEPPMAVGTETQAAETETVVVSESETAAATETVAPATPEPTNTPTPTPTPVTIDWSQPNPISCELHTGNASSLALGDVATWRCQTAVTAEITGEIPADLYVLWQIEAKYTGDDVRFSLPEGATATVQTPDPSPGGTSELVTYRTNWADGQSLTFDVTVTRTTCSVGETQLTLNAGVDIVTADTTVQISNSGEYPVDTRLASAAAPNGEPTVRFDGPIVFDALSATTAGLSSDTSSGIAKVVIEGEWNRCSSWTLNLGSTVSVPVETPAELHATSINNEPITGDACDLQTACDVITLPETGDAANPLRYTVGLELHLDELTPAGDFSIGLQSKLIGVETQP